VKKMGQKTYGNLLNDHLRCVSVCSFVRVSGLKTDPVNRVEAVWYRVESFLNICLIREKLLGLGKNRWYLISSCFNTRN